MDNNRVEDRLVALPWFQNMGVLFYRKDLLEKYRAELGDKYRWDLPRTWEDLTEVAAIIQKKAKRGK